MTIEQEHFPGSNCVFLVSIIMSLILKIFSEIRREQCILNGDAISEKYTSMLCGQET